jgi:hypothetical protein
MADIFISYVEEDSSFAIEIAQAMENRGFSAWYYERDSVPGPSYLRQTGEAIEACRAVILLISSHALGSYQVTREIVRAYESNKPFLPLLIDVSHSEVQTRQREWREVLGATASIQIPSEGIKRLVPQLIQGLAALGIPPLDDQEQGRVAQAEGRRQQDEDRHNLGAAFLVLLLLIGVSVGVGFLARNALFTFLEHYVRAVGTFAVYTGFVIVSLVAAVVMFGVMRSTGVFRRTDAQGQYEFGGAMAGFLVLLIFLIQSYVAHTRLPPRNSIYEIGAKVLVPLTEDGCLYPGTVLAAEQDRSLVRFDFGEEVWITPANLYLPHLPRPPSLPELKLNADVYVRLESTEVWAPGQIKKQQGGKQLVGLNFNSTCRGEKTHEWATEESILLRK